MKLDESRIDAALRGYGRFRRLSSDEIVGLGAAIRFGSPFGGRFAAHWASRPAGGLALRVDWRVSRHAFGSVTNERGTRGAY